MRPVSARRRSTSSATRTSSASRYMTQSPVAASKETLRAAEKSPSHAWCRTRAPKRLGDLDGAVGRAGVDDDDLVDRAAHGLQAAPEHRLLVLDDHAQAQRQALDGLAAAATRSSAGCRARTRPPPGAGCGCPCAGGACTRRCCARRAAARDRGGGRRRRAPRRPSGAELVEGDAGGVEHHGLRGASSRGRPRRRPRRRQRGTVEPARRPARAGRGAPRNGDGRPRWRRPRRTAPCIRPSRRRSGARWRRGRDGRRRRLGAEGRDGSGESMRRRAMRAIIGRVARSLAATPIPDLGTRPRRVSSVKGA